jgi:hypothetical protein
VVEWKPVLLRVWLRYPGEALSTETDPANPRRGRSLLVRVDHGILRTMKTCSKCAIEKLLSEFGFKNTAKKIYQGYCKACQRAYSKEHYAARTDYYAAKAKRNNPKYLERNKQYVLEYLVEHPCVDCGETDVEILQFDHIEMVRGWEKRVGSYMSGSLEVLLKEIQKCEVRCANCHFRRTRKQMGWHRVV